MPRGLLFILAVLVVGFGAYRLYLYAQARKRPEGARSRSVLAGLSPQRHLLFGILYLALGAILAASALDVAPAP